MGKDELVRYCCEWQIKSNQIYFLSSRYISMDVTGNTTFLPVHMHCIITDD
jgi:hypothetical protein